MADLRLRSFSASELLISFPGAVAHRERLVNGQVYRVKHGLLNCAAAVEVRRRTRRTTELQVSRDLVAALKVLPGLRYNLRIDRAARVIALGPVVGVFVNPRFLGDIERGEPPASSRHHAQSAWNAHVPLYYFSHERIDWLARTTVGMVYQGKGSWTQRTVPLPDVIYDRGVNFLDSEKPLVRYVRSQFRSSPEVQWINARDYFDKWWLFVRLGKYEELAPHLPETVRYQKISDVTAMLGRHGLVYLKAFYGRGGTQVLAVEEREPGRYLCSTARWRATLSSLEELESEIQRFFRSDQFVVQQGIRLLQHEGRNLDLRVLLQKDGRGRWQVTYYQVRVASGDSPVTNVHCHGEPFDFRELMPAVLGSRQAALAKEREVADFCVSAVRCIEREYGPFGEIGLDVALDGQDRIWLLEANAKADKNPEPYEPGPPYLQFTRIFEYARFLAGFSSPTWQVA